MGKLSRRKFIREAGAVAGATAIVPAVLGHDLATAKPSRSGAGPLILDGAATEPTVVSSENGLRATETALAAIGDGLGTLEGVVSGVNRVEEDPEDRTVGYGGLPNALGVVQLDSQVYHGPTRGVGAVAALEGFVHPSRVALAVMRFTDHVLLVGRGAARFASEMGFEETDLLYTCDVVTCEALSGGTAMERDVIRRFLAPLEFVALMVWWFYQSAANYDRERWWDPWRTYSVGTTVVQWGLLIVLLLLVNRWWAARVGAREGK